MHRKRKIHYFLFILQDTRYIYIYIYCVPHIYINAVHKFSITVQNKISRPDYMAPGSCAYLHGWGSEQQCHLCPHISFYGNNHYVSDIIKQH
jgi:hypothetical protein